MFKLLAGGRDITKKSNGIIWGTSRDTLGAQLSFESLYDIPEGTVVSTVFDGREDLRTVIVSKAAGRYTYSYTALDFAHLLKNEVVKQFNGMPASGAIRSLLGEYGIACRCVAIPTPITQIYKDSLSAILDDILAQATADQGDEYVRELQADTLVVEKLQDRRISPKLLIGGGLSVESSVTGLVNRVLVVSGGEQNTAIRAAAEDAASIAKYGLRQAVLQVEDKDAAQAGNIAANRLKADNRVTHTCTVEALALEGGQQVKANRLLRIRAGKLDGWYRIQSASHTLADGKHTISIGLEW